METKTLEQFKGEILVFMGGLELNPNIERYEMWEKLKQFIREGGSK
jgi:hypothetical protein